MKTFKILTVLFSFLIVLSCKEKEQEKVKAIDVLSFVDPFISTEGDHGHWHPSALVPFGMVKLGPDTFPSSLTGDGDWAHSGYNYSDSIVRGFSHFRTGSSGGGSIHDRAGLLSLLPFHTITNDDWIKNPTSEIDKATEQASPGYYSVLLEEQGIQAELTATSYVGMHRYSFKKTEDAKVLLSSGNSSLTNDLHYNVVDEHTIEGYFDKINGPYFTIVFNKPLIKNEEQGKHDKSVGNFICDFGKLTEPLLVKVGVSFTSINSANKNLKATCTTWDFENVKLEAEKLWRDRLSGIKIRGNNTRDKRIFYTALYHSCFLPIVQSDYDGTFLGFDAQLHMAENYKHYNGFAFWDSFRTKYPLYSLFCPDVYSDITSSIYDVYKYANNWDPFPNSDHKPHKSPLFSAHGKDGSTAFSTCRHEHMLMVMTDAYYKGLFHDELDIKDVYPYLKEETLLQMPKSYDSIGFIPARPDQTGEYSWDNWCVAALAKTLNKNDDYSYFTKRANYWKNSWDPEIKFFRARSADGKWLDFPEDPRDNREKYTYEGSKWHWRWNALHNMNGMIEALGGNKAFVEALDYFFENDLYTAGNQIDLHAPFLFNEAGAPWLTQKWVNQLVKKRTTQLYGTHGFFKEPILDYVYKDTPDGFLEEMDGDFGCMSAWYNLAAIGLYQTCPGDTKFQISTPIFEEITLDAFNVPFHIVCANFSEDNIYIQSAKLNGEDLKRSWLSYAEIAKGGKLELTLSKEPNKSWTIK
ncbi:glycoside hydrolase family 92 protein [Maribacter sp. ANRC-HE7]|uniref:Glycoside hydrolase family 92 protein n=1 Tax=Maribacter aquimaris TaxID=2737171 RepID=A0ABR7V294_9FLAO|nr:GH92 family glycosyl hydrolase [Maribacter aquimaris]MBD0777411.1 glycoside hydrolase family 92 protein [Maribacter aquimaris]